MSRIEIDKIEFRLATPADAHLPTYDNTKLVAVNVCPTWGIVRYGMHKSLERVTRAMALEAGSAMHEVFAWVRLCTLARADAGAFGFHMQRLFGDRSHTILNDIPNRDVLSIDGVKSGAISVLNTCGFYDDPRDKRRTLSNLEECALAYIDRWRWDQPVWQRDHRDITSDIGVEIPFDIVVDALTADGNTKTFRFTGKIDGIHTHHDGLHVHENKTAARLNDAWHMSFHTSSQVTGYCVAASVYSVASVRHADVLGLSVPMPRSYEFGGYLRDTYTRRNHHFQRWAEWALHSIQVYEDFADNPYDAPMYTHSCNRYYRPCSLIPFCDSDSEEQHVAIGEMTHIEWSPLHGLAEKLGDHNDLT